MSMLDAFDAGGNGLSDRPGRIGMYGHIGAPIFGGLDRGANFRFGVLGRFDRIVGRGDATARHQLDLARAVPQLLPRAQAHLIGAVGDGCDALDLGVAQRPAQCPRNLEDEPKISMARGLRDESARRIDARTNHDAFVDGALEPEHGTAEVAYRGETSHQRRFCLTRRQQLKVGGVGGHQEDLRRRCHECMPMRVNEAWHQHAPVRRNDVYISIGLDGDWVYRYALNDVAFNQHIGGSRERGALTVENADVLK